MDKSRTSAGSARVAAGIAIDASLAARTTIVVTLREGHGLAIATLESLLAHTPPAVPIFYLDIGSPPHVRTYLERRAAERGFTLLRFEWPTWPTATRASVIDRIDTDYVIFIENDIMVAPGWLEALVRCADETGAGLVGPLYLEGGGAEPITVHMAGGELARRATPAGDAIFENHRLMHAPLTKAHGYGRQRCDFVEYHCLLARREIFARGVALDRGFGCVHEHIDLALQVQALDLPIYIEPRAKVLQMRDGDYLLSDLPMLQWRWAEPAVDASIEAFCALWGTVPDEEAFRGVRIFTRGRRAQVDPVRRDLIPANGGDRIDTGTIARDKTALLAQMEEVGYAERDRRPVAQAYDLAAELHRNGCRPNGRPFLEHPVGLASLLVQCRMAPWIIVTGLLHAALSHGSLVGDKPPDLDDIVARIREHCGATIAKRVYDVTRLLADPRAWLERHRDMATLRLSAAVIVAIVAVDMIEEIDADGSICGCPPADDNTAWSDLVSAVAEKLDLPGLGTAWLAATAGRTPSWNALRQIQRHAYRSVGSEPSRQPMENGWFGAWLHQPAIYRGDDPATADVAIRHAGTR